jgi:hypothetical protein
MVVFKRKDGMQRMKKIVMLFLLFLPITFCYSYPLDGFENTGMQRLEGYLFSLQTPSGQKTIVRGARLKQDSLIFTLRNIPFSPPSPSASFTRDVLRALGTNPSRIAFSILDITNPEKPVLAAHNDTHHFIPASVGKIVVALAWFQRLKELYPKDIAQRVKLLKESIIEADELIVKDHHEVPLWNRETGQVYNKLLDIGVRGNVYMYLDWMISASSNAAGTMLMKELILLDTLGIRYSGATPEVKNKVWETIPKGARATILSSIVTRSLVVNGLKPSLLYQVSPFTKTGKSEIPARGSTATTRELLQYLTQLERALLVDSFSSAEIKKLMYSTQARARLASNPDLDDAAVYYKSGSNFKCNYNCSDNEGDVENLMNSIAIVEYPIENPKLVYLIALHSNVLRTNAVELHKEFGGSIHRLMKARHHDLLK